MLPPNAPNHTGLHISGLKASNVKAMSKELLGEAKEKKRPDWVNGLKELIWARMKEMRMGLEHIGSRYARCYMCLVPEAINDMEIEHISPWSGILAKLKADALTDSGRKQYTDAQALFINEKGSWVPTVWAGIYYSNDLDNLVFIHGRGCNQSKGAKAASEALLKNCYSAYGNVALWLGEVGYVEILKKAEASNRPLNDLIDGIKKNGPMWNQLGVMNDTWSSQMQRSLRDLADVSGSLQAVTPLPLPGEAMEPMLWKNPAKKPDGKPATANQTASMVEANKVATVVGRPRSFSDDMGVGDSVALSGSMERKLQALDQKTRLKRMPSDTDLRMPTLKKVVQQPVPGQPLVAVPKGPRAPGGPPIDAIVPAMGVPPPSGAPLLFKKIED